MRGGTTIAAVLTTSDETVPAVKTSMARGLHSLSTSRWVELGSRRRDVAGCFLDVSSSSDLAVQMLTENG